MGYLDNNHTAIIKELENLLCKEFQDNKSSKFNLEKMIHDLALYHQEISFQNTELQRLMLENDSLKKRYKRFFEEAPIGYIVFQQKGLILTANKTFCDMVGITFQKWLNRQFMEFVLPEYQYALCLMIDRVVGSGVSESIELRLYGAEGIIDTTITCNRYVQTDEILDELFSGGEVMVRCAITDITELKQKQEEIMNMSLHDSLTGIYNRRFYNEFLYQQDTESNLPLSVVMVDIDGLKLINDSLGHKFGDKAIITISKTLQEFARPEYILVRTGGDELVAILPKTELLTANAYIKKVDEHVRECILSGIPLSFSWGAAVKLKQTENLATVIAAAEDMMYSRKFVNTANKKNETVRLIVETLFERNKQVKNHSIRVSEVMRGFGKFLNLPKTRIEFLRQLGYLHDIGMASISDEIVNQPGFLTQLEGQEIKRHSEIGCRILRSVPGMEEIANCVMNHHENWDGTGFPNGMKGEQIPYEARILAIVDSYDRMCFGFNGAYPLTKEQVICEMLCCVEKQFDPALCKKFLDWRFC